MESHTQKENASLIHIICMQSRTYSYVPLNLCVKEEVSKSWIQTRIISGEINYTTLIIMNLSSIKCYW